MPMNASKGCDQLRALGWAEVDVRRFEELWRDRSRWGAINLAPEERQWLRKAEAALSRQGVRMAPTQPTLQRSPSQSKGTSWRDVQHDCFVALDFETADQGRDSACSVALVRVEKQTIVHREHRLIRPPRRDFVFTSIHGISWSQVANAPTFGELWPELASCLDGVRFIAAHNASFDASVMRACCDHAAVAPPTQPYVCTVQVARQAWNLRPTKLPDVCRHLGLDLKHHDALSDAEACARILLAAISETHPPDR